MTVSISRRRQSICHVLVTTCLIIYVSKQFIGSKHGELALFSLASVGNHFRSNDETTSQHLDIANHKPDIDEYSEGAKIGLTSKYGDSSFSIFSNSICPRLALPESVLELKTYGIVNSTLSKPHPCRFLSEGVRFGEFEELAHPVDVRQLLVFKSARTGSQMIYNILKQAVERSERPATVRFEPFSRIQCFHQHSVEVEELQIRNMLSLKCDFNSYTHVCNPGKFCRKWQLDSHHLPPLTVDLINSRFLDRVAWKNVIFSNTTQVFNLRRTNLVSMAYSYFRQKHKKCGRKTSKFSLSALLECVILYAIPDQEYSSSAALQAVQGLRHSGFLLLYEDFMKYQDLMEQQIFRSLNILSTDAKLLVSSTIHKVHKKGTICQYADVDCKTLRIGLEMLDYPCLLKQLDESGNAHISWSMPIDENNKISGRGDCHPLPPLIDPVTTHFRARRLEELYVYSKS